jgi:hypothetical protein
MTRHRPAPEPRHPLWGPLGAALGAALLLELGGLWVLEHKAAALEEGLDLARAGLTSPLPRAHQRPPPPEAVAETPRPQVTRQPPRAPSAVRPRGPASTARGERQRQAAGAAAPARPRPRERDDEPPGPSREEADEMRRATLDAVDAFAEELGLDQEIAGTLSDITSDHMDQHHAMVRKLTQADLSDEELRQELHASVQAFEEEISHVMGEEDAAIFLDEVMPRPEVPLIELLSDQPDGPPP